MPVSRGDAFVVNYLFDDFIQVRTDTGGSGVFREKSDPVIEGVFALDDRDSLKKMADYSRVIQAMEEAFRALPEKRNPDLTVMVNPWACFHPVIKGM